MIFVLLTIFFAIIIGTVICCATKKAVVDVGGRKVTFPLTIWSIKTKNEEGRAIFIGYGNTKFQQIEGHIEQLGSSHRFQKEGFEILIVTQKRWALFTQIEIKIKERGMK